ncbi:MAG: excisionase family DNA-binding protein [Propionibacteriaceae bacterium]|jgi:excisionase family DNA binding protein|nr:excisionase family DNA-binding protein [Propionibacteriaceae bacterium]
MLTAPDRQAGPYAAWLTLKDAAHYTGASMDTLRRRISDGQLRAYRVGRSHMVRLKTSDLDALMKPIPTVRRQAVGL